MGGENISLWLKLLAFAASGLLFLSVLLLGRQPGVIQILRTFEEFSGMVREKEKGSTWHHRSYLWLKKNGAPFHYGQGLQPVGFLAFRLILALGGLAVFLGLSPGIGLLAGGLAFLLPKWLLRYLNQRDNERMLPELKLIYHALEIQIRAGVYVTDALSECYGSVEQPRLKRALLDLAGDIVMKADIGEALEHFQEKFDNRYIDTLCITILQALESGQAVELLNDIGEQVKDMESAVLMKRKSALDRRLTFYQLGMLAAVLIVVLYASVAHILSAAMFFSG